MSSRLTVMILDDEPIVGKRLQKELTKAGLDVEAYVDPHRAWTRLNEKDFDVVVTDIRMQDMDGLEILERVKGRSKRTQVIMITGYATLETARESLAKGAFDFIAKPFKPAELKEVIARAAHSLAIQDV